MTNLTDKELTVIERIGDNHGQITQRQIAVHTGFSLGLINIILKKLTKKGYIKAKQLTPKKIQYILTRAGMVEKAGRSYNYIARTIRELRKIENSIVVLLENEFNQGKRNFGVIGNSDLLGLVKLAAVNYSEIKIIELDKNNFQERMAEVDIVLDCQEDYHDKHDFAGKGINLVEYISVGF